MLRKVLDVAAHWPVPLGPLQVPPALAAEHGRADGGSPSDALLEDMALHFIISGNTNATSIMIGEKAAELIAADHDVKLAEFVGSVSTSA